VAYTATLTVPQGGPSSLDYWAEATLPNATTILVFGPGTVNVVPGTFSRSFSQRVPGNAPLGGYTYTMKVGTYPGTVLAQGSFTATVTASAIAGRDAGDDTWRLYFEDGTLLEAGSTLDLRPAAEETADAPATAASSELPTEPALHTAFPNPFGTAATVPFDVAESSPVRMAVYDLLGREV
jgi:hypothetical protein